MFIFRCLWMECSRCVSEGWLFSVEVGMLVRLVVVVVSGEFIFDVFLWGRVGSLFVVGGFWNCEVNVVFGGG